jgi:hypothetical protein
MSRQESILRSGNGARRVTKEGACVRFLLELIAVAITRGPSYSYEDLSKSTPTAPLCKVHPRYTLAHRRPYSSPRWFCIGGSAARC